MYASPIDLQQLLSPIQEGAPCGPNLEYDPDFVLLESLVEGRPEQQYGDAVIPAEEPDWLQAERQAKQLLLRSKDLRVANHYLRALIHTHGLAGLSSGLELFAGLVQAYWNGLHPALEVDGEIDPLARFFSISALATPLGFMRDARDCVLLKHQNTSLSLRDIEQVGSNNRTESGLTRDQVLQILKQGLLADSSLLQHLERCSLALHDIEAKGKEALAESDAPDLSPVRQLIESTLRFCRQGIEPAPQAETPEILDSETGAALTSTPASPSASASLGAIKSRQDVERAIELICQYFKQHEPTNPAPLLLTRAMRVMSMSFMDIMRDMAPDALPRIETIAGPKAAE
jgi:type VI secretion system protein ImpA